MEQNGILEYKARNVSIWCAVRHKVLEKISSNNITTFLKFYEYLSFVDIDRINMIPIMHTPFTVVEASLDTCGVQMIDTCDASSFLGRTGSDRLLHRHVYLVERAWRYLSLPF